MIRQRAASRDRIALFVALLTLVSTGAASAQSPTFARRDYPSLGSDHLVADFNGDGKLDLAVANILDDNLSIFLGSGTGTLGAPTTVTVGSQPSSVLSGDFNGDGRADLAVAHSGAGNVGVLLGNGAGVDEIRAVILGRRADGQVTPAVSVEISDRESGPEQIV